MNAKIIYYYSQKDINEIHTVERLKTRYDLDVISCKTINDFLLKYNQKYVGVIASKNDNQLNEVISYLKLNNIPIFNTSNFCLSHKLCLSSTVANKVNVACYLWIKKIYPTSTSAMLIHKILRIMVNFKIKNYTPKILKIICKYQGFNYETELCCLRNYIKNLNISKPNSANISVVNFMNNINNDFIVNYDELIEKSKNFDYYSSLFYIKQLYKNNPVQNKFL